MLTEDYVSYETAKLLKEKGFDEPVYRGISINNLIFAKEKPEDFNYKFSAYCSQPTLQMAMKWLREVHNISIEPLVDFGNGNEYWWAADVAYIKKNGLIDELCRYNSYEEACENAIRYVLENLI